MSKWFNDPKFGVQAIKENGMIFRKCPKCDNEIHDKEHESNGFETHLETHKNSN